MGNLGLKKISLKKKVFIRNYVQLKLLYLIPTLSVGHYQGKIKRKYLKYSLIIFVLMACNQQLDHQTSEPEITTIDTDFSKGKLGLVHHINLVDLEKFHGHLCDGLVVGFLGLNEGLKILYPDGKVDRTNTRIVSKSSPCLSDAAVYLCGARYQFNTFYVSDEIDGIYIVQRIDNKKTVSIHLNQGVKPSEIDSLGKMAIAGELTSCELKHLKNLEDNFSSYLLNSNPKNNFTVKVKTNFQWNPVLNNDFIKTDILNKNKTKCK